MIIIRIRFSIVIYANSVSVQALERELAPVEERLSKLGKMTRKVTASNPQEGRQVQARHSEITGLWDKLKVCEIIYGLKVQGFKHWMVLSSEYINRLLS